jgi:hypothetical protein
MLEAIALILARPNHTLHHHVRSVAKRACVFGESDERHHSMPFGAALPLAIGTLPGLWVGPPSQAASSRRYQCDLDNLNALPIAIEWPEPDSVLKLPSLALQRELTVYDAAYPEIALRLATSPEFHTHACSRADLRS